MHGDLSGRSCTLASGRCEMLYTLLDPINPPAKLLRGAWDMTVGAQRMPERVAPAKVRLLWNDPLHPPCDAAPPRAVCLIDGSVPRRAGSTPTRRLATNIHSQLTPIRAVGNAPGPLAPRTSAHRVAQPNLSTIRPGTPWRRISPSPAHLPRPVHVARLLPPPCSCGLACALRRAACDESFESCNDLGLYARVLFGLDTAGYASVRGSAIRGRHLRASVRNSRRICVEK